MMNRALCQSVLALAVASTCVAASSISFARNFSRPAAPPVSALLVKPMVVVQPVARSAVARSAAASMVVSPARWAEESVVETNTSAESEAVITMAAPDPDMQKVLDALAELGPKPIEMLTPKDARKQPTPAMAVAKVLKDRGESVKPEEVASTDSRKLTVSDANGEREVPVVVYRPVGSKADDVLPVIVYFHGGGFVIAGITAYDASIRALANGSKAMVVAVDYRMAPENKWPAAHDDAYLATQWVLEHAAEIKGDAGKVAVAGESAGGNLATAVCLMAHDKGGKMPIHQLLVYPLAGAPLDAPSYIENAEAKPLNRAMISWFLGHYTTSATDADNKYFSPLKASDSDLKALPPATVITAQIDPIRSDGEMYTEKLKAAGVPVEYRNYTGVTHEFFGMGAAVAKAKEAEQFANSRLISAFGGRDARNASDMATPDVKKPDAKK